MEKLCLICGIGLSQAWRNLPCPEFRVPWSDESKIRFFGETQPLRKRHRLLPTAPDETMPTEIDNPGTGDQEMAAGGHEAEAIVEATPAPSTSTPKRPRSNERTPVKERPPIPGIPPEQQALAALMSQSMESAQDTIRTNEGDIHRVEEEARRRRESMIQKNHQIEKGFGTRTKNLEKEVGKMKEVMASIQNDLRRNRAAGSASGSGAAPAQDYAEPESEEMIIGGWQNLMAHEAVEAARELLARWNIYISEIYSRYRRPKVVHFKLMFPQDRVKLLREFRSRDAARGQEDLGGRRRRGPASAPWGSLSPC